MEVKPPLIIKSTIFVEPIQKANPEIGCPSINLHRNAKYDAIFALPTQASTTPV